MSLPNDMVDIILCRLPVKHLLRCRCVSKEWCSLIDSTAFAKKHLKITIESNAGSRLIIHGNGRKFYLADFESFDYGSAADVVEINDPLKTLLSGAEYLGAANGLVCVCKNDMNEILLCNPSTRKARKLPSAPSEFPRTFHEGISICGFGYDHVNDDYKVVKIAECQFQFCGFMVIVYSLKTNSWTRIRDVPNNISFDYKWGTFASGALHWLASKNPRHGLETIVAFDLGLEQFKEVPFPAVNKNFIKFNSRLLVSVGESLCILDYYPNYSVDVWLINKYGAKNPWYKAFSVIESGPLNAFPVKKSGLFGSNGGRTPLAFSKSHKDVLIEVDEAKLVWYNLERKTVKNVRLRGIPIKFTSYLYTESLLQLTEDKPLQKPLQDKQEKKLQKKRDNFPSKGFNLRL